MNRISVTKSFLPPLLEYNEYLKEIWHNQSLTNQGPLLKKFEEKINDFLRVKNSHFLTNGTIALQIALKALGIESGDIITTPFSYVATVSSILWERCSPIFVDIEPDNFTINVTKIEEKITSNTKAIMAVHVFGYACDVEGIERIAKKYNLKVIYDGAHAFGSKYHGKSLLEYGDISTCSFHATKLLHTIEGGLCIVRDDNISEKLELIKRFGHDGDDHMCLGINAKASEFQAAMGLCNIKYIDEIIARRKKISELYDEILDGYVQIPKKQKALEYNYAYYPILLKRESDLLKVLEKLRLINIFPRRYFYPALNSISYVNAKADNLEIVNDIASRILCLPLYFDLKEEEVYTISKVIKDSIV
jgi:dTDP-4-amino-4,6-dideoxygalactose transaminase